MLSGSAQGARFGLIMDGNKNVCKLYERAVVKSAHALRCSHCDVWVHVGCGALMEEDYIYRE